MRHLYSNSLISKHQHGFVNKSCTTNILESFDYITLKIELKQGIYIVYLDFSKAFDKVSHRLLVINLREYGFSDQLTGWIVAFLKDKKQRVVLGEASSVWTLVRSGVPQGTVLGPVLFIIYIRALNAMLIFLLMIGGLSAPTRVKTPPMTSTMTYPL
jgi:hypothetical protein